MKKTSLYSYVAPPLTIVELPSCSLFVVYVNNSKALVATYCESVLAGKSGGKHIGNNVEGKRRIHFVKSDLLGTGAYRGGMFKLPPPPPEIPKF
jgi:hypothetical protein